MSSELIRVSILWHEMWHEALEEASRLYFGEQNVEGMLGVLLPLHEKIEQEQAVTLKEISFVQARTSTGLSYAKCDYFHAAEPPILLLGYDAVLQLAQFSAMTTPCDEGFDDAVILDVLHRQPLLCEVQTDASTSCGLIAGTAVAAVKGCVPGRGVR